MTSIAQTDIRAVLFDKDGTLFDFSATWEVWASGLLLRLANNSRARAAELAPLLGYDFEASKFFPDSFVIAGTPEEVVNALSPEFPQTSRLELLNILNEEAANAPMVEAVPLKPFLGTLRKGGLKLGVATNDAEAPAVAHLGSVNVQEYFDFIAGSDSGYGAKPEPGQLLAFCDLMDVLPEHTVMVGDSTHDLLAGRAAGMQTAAVLTGLATAEELAPFANVVVPDIGHLTAWLGLD